MASRHTQGHNSQSGLSAQVWRQERNIFRSWPSRNKRPCGLSPTKDLSVFERLPHPEKKMQLRDGAKHVDVDVDVDD